MTRRPLVLQLIRDTDASQDYAIFLHDPEKKHFNFAQVRTEIQVETDRLTGTNKNISSVPIHLKIYSKNVIELTLVDLPGLTKVAVGDQPDDIESQIRQMVTAFVEKESCLILAVTPANTDLANSDALQLAKQVDPQGHRTLGVLTKLDLMDEGTHALDILNNKTYPLKHGFVGVVNRSQKDIESNKDVHSAVEKEKSWFSQHPVYAQIKERCGTRFLQEKLRQTLMHHIEKHLPALKHRLVSRLSELDKELSALKAPFSSLDASFFDTVGESAGPDDPTYQQAIIFNILRSFGSTIKMLIDGHDGDISNDAFNALGYITGTQAFDPNNKYADSNLSNIGPKLAELNSSVRIKYIFQDIFPSALHSLESRILSSYYDDEIRTMIHNVRGLRAGLFIPDSVFELLIKKHILQLESPAMTCVDMVHVELAKMIRGVLEGPQSPVRMFPALLTWMINVTQWVLDSCKQPCVEEVKRLIEMEVAYINTAHPDFLGNKGLGEWMVSEKKRRAKMRRGGLHNSGKRIVLGHKDGWLTKLGGSRKTWKKRWFVVKDGSVYFFEQPGDKSTKGEFSLEGCLVRDLSTNEVFPMNENGTERKVSIDQLDPVKDTEFAFELLSEDGEVIFRNHRHLVMRAENEQEKEAWIQVLSESIEYLNRKAAGRMSAIMEADPPTPEVSPEKPSASGGQTGGLKRRPPPPLPPPVKPKPTTLASRPTSPIEPGTLSALPDKLFATDLKNTTHQLANSSLSPELKEHEDGELSATDDTTITLVRILIHSYFQIIRKHVQDLVPKAIMYLMVGKIKRDLPTVLMRKALHGEDGHGSKVDVRIMLKESDGSRQEREQKAKMAKMLRDALKVIDSEVQNALLK